MIDVSDTIIAKSDQLNADDLISGPITITITEVNKPGGDQPINIKYQGGRVPFKPCKTVRRILVKAWGKDASTWTGRQMTLFNDANVKWAGRAVGGIRVSHLSHIASDMDISLTETRGSKKGHVIKKLEMQQQPVQSTNAEKIELVKSDGSIVQFGSFDDLKLAIETNLPKMETMDRVNNFEKANKQLFNQYFSSGYQEEMTYIYSLIKETKNRIEVSTDAGI